MTTDREQNRLWRKSSYSGTNGSCVEVAKTPDDLIAMRNSNHPDAGTLEFTRTELAAWISGCKAGRYFRSGRWRGHRTPSRPLACPVAVT